MVTFKIKDISVFKIQKQNIKSGYVKYVDIPTLFKSICMIKVLLLPTKNDIGPKICEIVDVFYK